VTSDLDAVEETLREQNMRAVSRTATGTFLRSGRIFGGQYAPFT